MVSLRLPSRASACSRRRAMRTLPSKAISLRGLILFAEGFFDTLDFIANGFELRGREARYALFLARRLVGYRPVGSAVRLVDAFSLVSKTTRT
jgi:hypothetical protein